MGRMVVAASALLGLLELACELSSRCGVQQDDRSAVVVGVVG